MPVLHEVFRRGLERRVVEARELSERGASAALLRLGVAEKSQQGHLSADERALRNRLRARARALGDKLRPSGVQDVERLTEEVAYEAWHRMLFARFLAENDLLVHPEHGVSVSLAECEELAAEEGAEDKWVLASRYAARMLPQIFRPDDPSLQVRFAPEHRVALEQLLESIEPEVFRADDSLGWVYQFWQSKRKDEVNAAGEPITGETLPAVTQLFTEPYMVSFLLENTIGAWWSARHPGQPLPIDMPYLRRLEDGTPAAGSFDGWPESWSEFTMLDPCCGSGHFLVAALRILVPLRMQDDELSAAKAVDSVIEQNLFGLELDARCTQIAAFAVALAAWTTKGAKGYRPLPEFQIACSGLAVGAKREEWLALADKNTKLEAALGRLYDLFKLAPELGSLIDPTAGGEDLMTASFSAVQPLLEKALRSERVSKDAQLEATAVAAHGIAKAAELLARKYTLIGTNVPYLGRGKQGETLQDFLEDHFTDARDDLAAAFVERSLRFARPSGTASVVAPQSWLFQTSYRHMRHRLMCAAQWNIVARLGPGAFATIGGEVVNVALTTLSAASPAEDHNLALVDVSDILSAAAKADALVTSSLTRTLQSSQRSNPDSILALEGNGRGTLLGNVAYCYQGISPGDTDRLVLAHWELPAIDGEWAPLQGVPLKTGLFAGREHILRWSMLEKGFPGSAIRGGAAWSKEGIAMGQMSNLPATLYTGERFASSTPVIIPDEEATLPALWAFCSSPSFNAALRRINPKMGVSNGYVGKISFDIDHWRSVAEERYPDGLPEPYSDDPTQWLFKGDIVTSTEPLQVAVARLLGYCWPEQAVDDKLDSLTDADGIVCLPPVRGERPASERLQALLAAAYGKEWSPAKRDELLSDVDFAGKSLEEWLRDGFFSQHCALFHQRPFIWHIWDGRKDGFSALLNYHKLDRKTLETLTYTYLGDWIARQEEAKNRDERGAEARLVAAKDLRDALELILEGEPPYDIFVRWKPLDQQPVGWEPDLNDGVRVNIWPFVEAGVLRGKVTVNWKKDRGKNPPGSPWGEDRHNRYEDIPAEALPPELKDVEELTTVVKRDARGRSTAGERAAVAGSNRRTR